MAAAAGREDDSDSDDLLLRTALRVSTEPRAGQRRQVEAASQTSTALDGADPRPNDKGWRTGEWSRDRVVDQDEVLGEAEGGARQWRPRGGWCSTLTWRWLPVPRRMTWWLSKLTRRRRSPSHRACQLVRRAL